MPRVCNTCSHPDVREIDKLLLGKTPHLTVSLKFNVSRHSVSNHYNKHLRPLVKDANGKAEAQIVDHISAYRREVNYPPLDKVKCVQDQLWNEYYQSTDSALRIRIIKELRGWFQEEAKLCGLYSLDDENPEIPRRKALAVLHAVAELQEQYSESDPKQLLAEVAKIAANED